MRDPFYDVIAVQRIELVTRLVLMGRCEPADRDLALDWVSELSADLLEQLRVTDKQNPQSGGSDSGLLQ